MDQNWRHAYKPTITDGDGDVIMADYRTPPSSYFSTMSQNPPKNTSPRTVSNGSMGSVSPFDQMRSPISRSLLPAPDVRRVFNGRLQPSDHIVSSSYSEVPKDREQDTLLHDNSVTRTRRPQRHDQSPVQPQSRPATSLPPIIPQLYTGSQHHQLINNSSSMDRQLPPIATVFPLQLMPNWTDRLHGSRPSETSSDAILRQFDSRQFGQPPSSLQELHTAGQLLASSPSGRGLPPALTQATTSVNSISAPQIVLSDATVQHNHPAQSQNQSGQILNAIMEPQQQAIGRPRLALQIENNGQDIERTLARRLAVPVSRKKKTTQTKRIACAACMEDFIHTDLVSVPCGCRYCHECLNRIFKAGCTSAADFPPKCHGKALRINVFGSILEKEVVSRYKEVEAEFSCKRPFYCALENCSAFIAEKDIVAVGGYGICGECNQCTCTTCKMLLSSHKYENQGRQCPQEPEELLALRGLCEDEEWKQCPSCQVMVEKVDGCDHIECQCGVEFCYRCGSYYTEFDECDCPGEDASDDEGRDEDEDEAWPQHRRMLDPLGRPVCAHLDTDLLAGEICHGCLKPYAQIHSCIACGIELCKECLAGIRVSEGDDDSVENELMNDEP